MPFGDWIVGVFLKFSTDGPQTIGRLQASMEGLNDRIKVQNGLIDRNAALMAMQRRRMEELRSSYLRNTATGAGVASAAIGAGLWGSVKEAADVQSKLNLYQMQTGSSQREMLRVQQQVFDTARMTAQSAGNVADQFVTIAQMNLPMRLMTGHMLDQMAKYSDVVNLASRGEIGTSDALKIGISTAHQLGIYDPAGVQAALTAQARTSLLLPHGLQRFATQAKYYAPWVRMFGDSPQNISSVMSLANLIDVSGLSTGRGGTSVRAFMDALVPSLQTTKHMQSGKLALLKQMHLLRGDGTPTSLVLDKQGKTYLDPEVFTDALYTYVNSKTAGKTGSQLIKARADIVSAFGGEFSTTGKLFASILSTSGMQQLRTYHDRFSKTPKTIDEMQAKLLDTFSGSVQKFGSAVERFGAAIAIPSLPTLADALNRLANDIDGFTGYFTAHPLRAKLAFAGLATGAGILGAGALGILAAPWFTQIFANRGIAQSIAELGEALRGVQQPARVVAGLVDQWGRPLSSVANELGAVNPATGRLATLLGEDGVFGAVSRANIALAIFTATIGEIIDIADYWNKYHGTPPRSAIDPFNKAQWNPRLMPWLYGDHRSAREIIHAGQRLQGGAAFDADRRSRQPTLQFHGDIKIVVPKGTTSQQAHSILQQFLAIGNTSAGLPNPRTVGGLTAAHS